MSYVTINMYISGETRQDFKILFNGLNLYIDPTSWVQHLGFSLHQNNSLKTIFETAGSLSVTLALILLSGNLTDQLRNTQNILLISDHGENIGFFFYIAIETFILHIYFFLCAYLLYVFCMLINIRYLIIQAKDVIDLTTKHDKLKNQDRQFRLRCLATFLVMFMKIIFNQYPLLYDHSLLLFIVFCMNLRVVNKYSEGVWLLNWIIGYSIIMTFAMWS